MDGSDKAKQSKVAIGRRPRPDKLQDFEMCNFWHQTINLQTAALQSRRFPKLAASLPVEAVFSTTGLILNGKRSVLASSIEFHSFMTIMHTCLILNREKTINMNDFRFFFQWRIHWFHQCGLYCSTLTLICPAFCCPLWSQCHPT